MRLAIIIEPPPAYGLRSDGVVDSCIPDHRSMKGATEPGTGRSCRLMSLPTLETGVPLIDLLDTTGTTLRERLERTIPPAEALTIAAGLLEALAHAPRGRPPAPRLTALTAHGTIAGTPGYMSPEQIGATLAGVPDLLPLIHTPPAGIDAVLRRGLATRPTDRFASAGAFLLARDRFAEGRLCTRPERLPTHIE